MTMLLSGESPKISVRDDTVFMSGHLHICYISEGAYGFDAEFSLSLFQLILYSEKQTNKNPYSSSAHYLCSNSSKSSKSG